MKNTIDARGLSCPEPVIMLKKIINNADEIELLADNKVCVENCTRFANARGYDVFVNESPGEYILTITKRS